LILLILHSTLRRITAKQRLTLFRRQKAEGKKRKKAEGQKAEGRTQIVLGICLNFGGGETYATRTKRFESISASLQTGDADL
jgi:hypothetical protein